ncbi:protein FAR1-RELATED SEQUENCE 9-like [Salvia hispanica]|uniref:protein FAR1-RELATED SEQUENCE 9-like n=1 Tax=Salvia hispanica TaxID=49212 RepID=UPI002009160F|nr:protein FAR1-RELATED SEQUENCE 9-like [Salvia hispanica]
MAKETMVTYPPHPRVREMTEILERSRWQILTPRMESDTNSTSHVDNQSYSDDVVENTDLNTPECPIELKPFVGRSFPTLDNAIEFYENYGRRVGFDTRKNGSKKVDNLTIWFYMVCNREDCAGANIGPSLTFKLLTELMGGYDSVGCTVLDIRNYTRDIRRYAEGYDAQMIIDEMKKKKESCDAFTYEYEVDSRSRLTHLFWCDPIAKKNFMQFGDIVSFDTTYSTNRYSMIFAPFTGKDNHGRAVSFGAGLLCSESADSFSWLFKQFIKCMGLAPKLIITDQDLGMKVAVENVLVNTRHRWCMWYIMAKVAEKVPKSLLGNSDFKKDLNSCVWSELIEPTEFEDKWKTVMETYELEDAEWFVSMFESREFWVPAYFRDFPNSSLIKTTSVSESQNSFFKRYTQCRANLVMFLMNFNNAVDAQRNQSAKLDYMDVNTTAKIKTEWSVEKHASTIFTDYAFKEIQEQILEAYNHCSLISISNESSPELYKVLDHYSNTWDVTLSVEDSLFQCGCKMFSRIGLVCCHIFHVLKNKKMRLIPENLIGGRWLKSPLVKAVHAVRFEDVATHVFVDEKKNAQAILLGEILGLYQAVSFNIDQIHELTSIVREARQQIFAGGVVTSTSQKKKLIEEFYGAEAPQEVDVQPPDVVSTKGSGSRLPSRVEKALKIKSKPLRQCKKCQEWGHHDSRNCVKFKEKEKRRSRRNSEV